MQVVLSPAMAPLPLSDAAHIWRNPVRVDEVSLRYVDAVLAYEDRWFHWHPGCQSVALLRWQHAMGVAWPCGVRRLHAHDAGGAHAGATPHA